MNRDEKLSALVIGINQAVKNYGQEYQIKPVDGIIALIESALQLTVQISKTLKLEDPECAAYEHFMNMAQTQINHRSGGKIGVVWESGVTPPARSFDA